MRKSSQFAEVFFAEFPKMATVESHVEYTSYDFSNVNVVNKLVKRYDSCNRTNESELFGVNYSADQPMVDSTILPSSLDIEFN